MLAPHLSTNLVVQKDPNNVLLLPGRFPKMPNKMWVEVDFDVLRQQSQPRLQCTK